MSIEVIEMIAHIAVAIAVIFSGVMLGLSCRTFSLQRKNLQANMFNNITSRINNLIDTMPPKDKEKESFRWNIKILNAFEYFSFFANHGYLEIKMVSHYKNFITIHCDKVKKECPSMINYLAASGHSELYKELKEYYKSSTGRDAPI